MREFLPAIHDRKEKLEPGRPGRGYDPTAGFTDLQWYLYHNRDIAYFAAFSSRDYSEKAALQAARMLVAMAPQLGEGYRGAARDRPPADPLLARVVSVETLESLEGFPERWLDGGMAVYSDPDLPFFRIRIARLAEGSDANGRRSFVLVWVSHVFVEGTDFAELSRSRSAAHPETAPAAPASPLIILLARAAAALAIPGHLVVSRFWKPHPEPICSATRAVPRRTLAGMARALGIRQRALMMALAAHVMYGGGLAEGKRRISISYSTLGEGGGAHRDSFMRMRLLLATVENREGIADFAQALDARLTEAEARETGFNAELNATAIGLHRRLAARLPALYGPEVFSFMPYDMTFGLIPPHRLAGPLAEGLMEPVYAGATLPGVNGCVAVPGRDLVTLNFSMEKPLLPNLTRLDRLLDTLP